MCLRRNILHHLKQTTNNRCNMWQRCYHHNHAPPSHIIKGYLISFYQNHHRLLDWYTEHIAQSLTHTIVVHCLSTHRIVMTANFKNFPKGKPFTEILGNAPLRTSLCCLDLNKPLSPLLTTFDTTLEVSVSCDALLVWKVKRMLNVSKKGSEGSHEVGAWVGDEDHKSKEITLQEKRKLYMNFFHYKIKFAMDFSFSDQGKFNHYNKQIL